MNNYDTFCEARGCRAMFYTRAESFDDAIEALRRAGWYAKERDARGYESYCAEHAPRLTWSDEGIDGFLAGAYGVGAY